MCKIFERLDVMQPNFFSFQKIIVFLYYKNTYVLSIKNLKNVKFMLTLQYIVWEISTCKTTRFLGSWNFYTTNGCKASLIYMYFVSIKVFHTYILKPH